MRRVLALVLVACASAAFAERPVYRDRDARGTVVYSDRPAGPSSTPVRQWTPANPSRFEYDSAVLRNLSDRLVYERLRAEARQPRPVLLYAPRAQAQPSFEDYTRALPWQGRRRGGYDPNLPDAQGPSLERRYHYDGR